MKGNERNMRFFRDTQRDERQCLQYGTRCGALKADGQPKARDANDTMVYGLSGNFYSGKNWKITGSSPSWKNEKDAKRTHELRNQPTDNSTLGYEDM